MTDDDDLWHQVTKNVTPLGNRPKVEVPKNTKPKINRHNRSNTPKMLDEKIIFGGVPATDNSESLKINTREARRISRGTMSINSTIDLHGHGREAAYKMLVSHITNAHSRGEKLVLVITGKGSSRFPANDKTPLAQRRFADFERQEGVIKQALPGWLNGADLNDFVSSYKTAAGHHGGSGAVYVRLRRQK